MGSIAKDNKKENNNKTTQKNPPKQLPSISPHFPHAPRSSLDETTVHFSCFQFSSVVLSSSFLLFSKFYFCLLMLCELRPKKKMEKVGGGQPRWLHLNENDCMDYENTLSPSPIHHIFA